MNEFPNENIDLNRKLPSESEVVGMIRRGELELPPVEIHIDSALMERYADDRRFDGFLKVTWRNKSATFLFEHKSSNTPKVLETAIVQVKHYADRLQLQPLVIVPYLSEESLGRLDSSGVSGIDLCGNGILIAEDFQFWRSGQTNRFRDSRPIRNPFRGDSAIFAKCFLLRDQFSSLLDLVEFAQERTFGAFPAFQASALTQGTASKVVQALTEELITRRSAGELVLQDKQRLLKLLQRDYRKAEVSQVVGTSVLSPEQIWDTLCEERTKGSLRAVATGLSSVKYYQVLSGVNRHSFYVDDIVSAASKLQIRAGKAFANIELCESTKNTVYFDARQDGNKLWASPIQTWLELMALGPREQEAAKQIEQMLISPGDNEQWKV